MPVEIRSPTAEELLAVLAVNEAAFGEAPEEWYQEVARKLMPPAHVLGAFDDGRAVGAAAAYPCTVSIPGGELQAAAVTWVGVLPSHRRRGILRSLMMRLHEDSRTRGDVLGVLWASEAGIYGRFGYGVAIPLHRLDASKVNFAFRDDRGPRGEIRIVTEEEAATLFPPVYERVRATTAGMLSRSDAWWRDLILADHDAAGWGPRFRVALEQDGAVVGYAIYRVKNHWDNGLPQGKVRVIEAIADSSEAARELWRFLFSIDLTETVEVEIHDPGSPLFLQVVDPRRLRLRVSDAVWLALLDVEAALRARAYSQADPVVLDVRDTGRFRVPGGEPTGDRADLALDVRDLASAYLGGFGFHELARAGRVDERTPGAVARAHALFRTERPPFCPEEF